MVCYNSYIILILILVSITIIYLYLYKENFQDQSISNLLQSGPGGSDGDLGDQGDRGLHGQSGPQGPKGNSALNMILDDSNSASNIRDSFEITTSDSASDVINKLVQVTIDEIIDDLNDPDNSEEYDSFNTTLVNQIRDDIYSENSSIETTQAQTTQVVTDTPMRHMIVPYCGCVAPNGWQICNGEQLKYVDDTPVVGENTPDLRGRFVLGSGEVNFAVVNQETDGDVNVANEGTNSRLATSYNIGSISFEDTVKNVSVTGTTFHKIIETELPTHTHTYTKAKFNAYSGYQLNVLDGSGNMWRADNEHDTGNADFISQDEDELGADEEHHNHNNMPPFLILMYIIKQPLVGSN